MLKFGIETRFIWTSFCFSLLSLFLGVLTEKDQILEKKWGKKETSNFLGSNLQCLSFRKSKSCTVKPTLYLWCHGEWSMPLDFGIWKWEIVIIKVTSVIIAACVMTKVKVLCMVGLIWVTYILQDVNRNFSPLLHLPIWTEKLIVFQLFSCAIWRLELGHTCSQP